MTTSRLTINELQSLTDPEQIINVKDIQAATWTLYGIAIALGVSLDKCHFWIAGNTSVTTEYYLFRDTGKIYTGYEGVLPSTPDSNYTLVKSLVDINSSVSSISSTLVDTNTKISNGKFAHRGAFHNLVASTTGLSLVYTVSAESLYLADPSYNIFGLRNVSQEISTLDTGAITTNTWYYPYVIYNPTTNTVSGVLSLSPTSPLTPSGYTYYARVGSLYTSSATAFLGMDQSGKQISYKGSGLTPLSAGASTSGTSISLSAYIPPSASDAVVMFGSNVIGYTMYVGSRNAVWLAGSDGDNRVGLSIQIVSTQTIYYIVTGGTGVLNLRGYTDNI